MAYQPSPSRLEAFSDGVIAVIITIMVLEFKVPHENGFAGLRAIAPTLAVYALSYAFTGIYWVNHHHLVHRLKRVDHIILWANLGFLFCLSLLPFFTNYLVEKGVHAFPVALYATSQLLDGITFTLLSKALVRHIRHAGSIYDDNEARDQIAENKKAFLSLAMYLIAIPTAYWRPWPALTLIAAVTLIWIVPTFGIKPIQNEPLRPNH